MTPREQWKQDRADVRESVATLRAKVAARGWFDVARGLLRALVAEPTPPSDSGGGGEK